MPTRKEYITLIWMYEKRRAALDRHNPKEKSRMDKMYLKIRTYRRAIKRIDRRMEIVRGLIQDTNAFFDMDISCSGSGKEISLARFCYYKYGIESGCIGRDLSVAIKKHKYSAAKRRREFVKSFQKKPENKKAYHSFKSYMDRQEK